MLRLLRIWPSLGGSCASLESLDLSVYGSLGRHKNPLERAQILNSPRWVWIISHCTRTGGGQAPLRLSFVDEKRGVPPLLPSSYAHSARFPPAQSGLGRLSKYTRN